MPRWATPRTPSRETHGPVLGRIAAELGTPFMPWQQRVADVALEIDPTTGRLAYREVRLTVPRQSGKTSLMLALVLHRALGQARQRIAYTAQTGSDARKKWQDDWLPALEHTRFRRFFHPRLANGHEALVFVNQSMQTLMATTEKAGHGGSIDLAISDEAFALPDARVEQAVKPAMLTRPEPQFWIPSTAGTPTKSPYLYAKVLGGRKIAERQVDDLDARRGICHVEYSAPDEADPFDRRVWWDTMPALGYTQTEEAVAADLQSMLDDPKQGLNEFRRAYLNQWPLAMGDPIVPLDHWQNLSRSDAPRPPWVVLGLSVAPEDASASVVACGGDLTGYQTTVLEHGDGVDWLFPSTDDPVGALGRIVEEWDHPFVVVDEKRVAHLLPEIERVCGGRVTALKGSQIPTACAFWLRLVKESRLCHRGEPELTVALAGAERSGGRAWQWAPERSGADVSPLEAQTLAVSFWCGELGDTERTDG